MARNDRLRPPRHVSFKSPFAGLKWEPLGRTFPATPPVHYRSTRRSARQKAARPCSPSKIVVTGASAVAAVAGRTIRRGRTRPVGQVEAAAPAVARQKFVLAEIIDVLARARQPRATMFRLVAMAIQALASCLRSRRDAGTSCSRNLALRQPPTQSVSLAPAGAALVGSGRSTHSRGTRAGRASSGSLFEREEANPL